jgi:hypothetical protein
MLQVDPRLDYGLSALPLVESPAVLQVTTVLFLSLIFSLNSNNSVGYYNINNRIGVSMETKTYQGSLCITHH